MSTSKVALKLFSKYSEQCKFSS